MKKTIQPYETRAHDLTGVASIDLYKKDFNEFARGLVKYNPDRFEPVALKVNVVKGKLTLTLFALDQFKQDQSNYPKNRLPVKKFKMQVNWNDFLLRIKRFNMVVTNDSFDIEDMIVINK